LGVWTFRPDVKHEALIALAGPLCSLALAAIIKTVGMVIPFSSFVVDKFVAFNVLYALYTMLPIPPLDGFKVIWFGRLTWAFCFGAIFGFMFLALAGIISIVFPLLIGFLAFIGWYFYVE